LSLDIAGYSTNPLRLIARNAFQTHVQPPEAWRVAGLSANLYTGKEIGEIGGKMKVKIVDRKVYLPKKVLDQANLPERGSCDVAVVGDEIRIRRPSSEELNVVKILKTPVKQSVKKMAEAEEVEDV
jgi:hypothetical protein